jgi:hypothetical protein
MIYGISLLSVRHWSLVGLAHLSVYMATVVNTRDAVHTTSKVGYIAPILTVHLYSYNSPVLSQLSSRMLFHCSTAHPIS